MSAKSQLSPISMGAIGLTMGMSLVSPAQASIIAGDTASGKQVLSTNYTLDYNNVDGESGGFERDGISRTDHYQQDRITFDIETGQIYTGEDSYDPSSPKIYITDYYNDFSYADRTGNSPLGYSFNESETFYGGYLNTYNDHLLFSKMDCTTLEYSGFGEDYNRFLDPANSPIGEDCLSNLSAGTTIDQSWFNGTYGQASNQGLIYGNGYRAQFNETQQQYTYEESINLSSWDVTETGYVAFVFNSDVGYYEYSENPINTDGAPSWYDLESTHYGFLEITRGSISISSVVTSQAAPAVNVPEPTGLALFSLGLFGLFSRKFKKSAK